MSNISVNLNKTALAFPSLSGTFGIPAWLALKLKMPKEPSSPSRSIARIEQQCFDRQIDDKIEQGQRTTRNIRKPGDVGNLNFCTFNKNYSGLTSWSFEIPASAYCHPLAVIDVEFAKFTTI